MMASVSKTKTSPVREDVGEEARHARLEELGGAVPRPLTRRDREDVGGDVDVRPVPVRHRPDGGQSDVGGPAGAGGAIRVDRVRNSGPVSTRSGSATPVDIEAGDVAGAGRGGEDVDVVVGSSPG